LLPQNGPQVQFAWQALEGHAPPGAAPSHCSLPFTTPSPQKGPHVQFG
jgi:hypothetical protein